MSQRSKEQEAIYREKNRLWIRVYKRRWHHKTKRERGPYLLEYYRKNKEWISRKSAVNNQKRRQMILSMLGSKCVKCGFDDYRALHIDHVHGGGNKERKNMSHSWGSKFWENVLSERKDDYQILCANCNWIKRYEKRELFKCLV